MDALPDKAEFINKCKALDEDFSADFIDGGDERDEITAQSSWNALGLKEQTSFIDLWETYETLKAFIDKHNPSAPKK